MREPSWVVALDGGTSNTRAVLFHGGRIVANAGRAVGVRDAVATGGVATLASAVRDAIGEVLARAGGVRPDAIVAAGMLTSEVGLAAVPHALAPAGLDVLAGAAVLVDLPDVAEVPILFIPGVRTPPADGPGGWTQSDVMRGEECQCLGVLQMLKVRGSVAVLWPGSHSKLVLIDERGRIVRSTTSLAGELTAAVARHTILAASLPDQLPADPDPDAYRAGADAATSAGLGRAAFLVRVAALTGSLDAEQRAAFWVGAVLSDDARHLAGHSILSGPVPLWVGGPQPQRRLYAEALRGTRAGPVVALSDEVADSASAVGALEVAKRFELRAKGGS